MNTQLLGTILILAIWAVLRIILPRHMNKPSMEMIDRWLGLSLALAALTAATLI